MREVKVTLENQLRRSALKSRLTDVTIGLFQCVVAQGCVLPSAALVYYAPVTHKVQKCRKFEIAKPCYTFLLPLVTSAK